MIFIKRNRVPKVFESSAVKSLKRITSDFFQRNRKDRIQEKFKFPPFPETIKKEVNKQFKSKCAYCESKVGDFSPSRIDNYRPKRGARGFEKNEFNDDHYWWLAFDWENLYLSCPQCNYHKASWFPVDGDRATIGTKGEGLISEKALLLDPCFDLPSRHLSFSENGTVSYFTAKGEVTIEILKLNRPTLTNSRKASYSELKKNFENFKKNILANDIDSAFRDFDLVEILLEHPMQSFIGLKRQFLFKWVEKSPKLKEIILERLLQYEGFSSIGKGLSPNEGWNQLSQLYGFEADQKESMDKFQDDFSKLDSIERIEIKNFRTISYFDIVLKPNDETRAPWLLFLGENGLGKSSILQAIAFTLVDDKYRSKLPFQKYLKRKKKNGFIRIYLTGKSTPIELKFNKDSYSISGLEYGSYLLAYGAIRLLPQIGIKSETTNGNIRVMNLFKPTVALHNASKWLSNLEEDRFNYMARALKEILQYQNVIRISKSKTKDKINIVHSNGTNSLEEMSEGYKSVVALAIDIMQILERDGTTMEEAQGVVLIDEIGSHLHPRWKMRIVDCFRNVFPLVQFIVTSHDPLCLRGLEEGEVIVLKRNYNTREVEVLSELPSPSGFRVDQLLTSEFFGLHSTSDPNIELLFNKYYKLLALSKLTNNESEELEDLKNKLMNKKYLGNTLREELMYSVIDNLLAKEYNDEKVIDKNELKEETILQVKKLWQEIDFIK